MSDGFLLGLFLLPVLIGLRTRRRCYLANLKKNKIENPYFLFPPLLIFILIMYRKNKKTIKTVHWHLNKAINFSIAAGGQHTKTDIFEITIYFCSFTIL